MAAGFDGSAVKKRTLFRPDVRQFRKARQLLRCQLRRLGAIQNTIDKVRREKGELEGAAEVGSVKAGSSRASKRFNFGDIWPAPMSWFGFSLNV